MPFNLDRTVNSVTEMFESLIRFASDQNIGFVAFQRVDQHSDYRVASVKKCSGVVSEQPVEKRQQVFLCDDDRAHFLALSDHHADLVQVVVRSHTTEAVSESRVP